MLSYRTDGMPQEYRIAARMRFAPFSTRSASARTFTLGEATGRIGSNSTSNFSAEVTLLSGQFALASGSDRVRTVSGPSDGWADKYWPAGMTRFATPKEQRSSGGLLQTISQADLRDTSIYVFRESDGKLLGAGRALGSVPERARLRNR